MTTENVAILFTDIVGSTELSQRLSAEVADEVRRGHFSILRQAIAEAGGTEVKNLGDGLMVVFSSASAALACAVAMQQGVERDNRDREHSVGLRVGPERRARSAERTTTTSGTRWSRRPGSVPAARAVRSWPTDWCELTAGRRSRHECRSLGELTLKGLPDPVETVEVLWEPLGVADHRDLDPAPRPSGRAPCGRSGRPREPRWRRSTDAVKRVAGGRGARGAPRLGRGRSGQDHRWWPRRPRSAFDNGACVLFGHCEEDLATPYQLFAEALGHYVTHAPEDQLLAHVEAHGSELVPAGPGPGQQDPGPPAVEGHRLRHRAVPALCRRGGAAGHGVGAPARRPRPRRPPVGRQGEPAAAAPPGGGRADHAGARPRDLSRQRAVTAPTRCSTPWLPCIARAGSPASSCPGSMTAGWWPSWRPPPVTASTTPGWASPTPSTGRPTATRSS